VHLDEKDRKAVQIGGVVIFMIIEFVEAGMSFSLGHQTNGTIELTLALLLLGCLVYYYIRKQWPP
jgi:hypothetical protein